MADVLDQITEDSTREDMDEIVDQIIADQQSEPPEETSDAEKVGIENVTTERNTGDEETSDAETAGDDKPPAKSKADWRTDDTVSEAATYGIDEDELSTFSSREELDRALKLFDRQLDAEREKTGGDPEEKADLDKTTDDTVTGTDGQYKVGLDPDIYDEELVEEFARMRDHYEGRMAALEERFHNADAVADEAEFDRAVDEMGFAKLFGKTGEENKSERERRQQLFEQVTVEREVLTRMGRAVGTSAALVERVARSVFPDEYDKKLLKNHTRKISRQSGKRQGDGATRPTDPPQGIRQEMRDYFKELDTQSG